LLISSPKHERNRTIVFKALRDIEAHEELTWKPPPPAEIPLEGE